MFGCVFLRLCLIGRELYPHVFLLLLLPYRYLYATIDVATMHHRCSEGYNQVVYVTDSSQSQHFTMLFQVRESHRANAYASRGGGAPVAIAPRC